MGFTKNISANCRSQNRPSLDVRNSQIIREEIRKDSRWRHQYDNGAGLRPVEYCTQRTYVKQQPRKTSRGDTMRSTCHTDFTYPQVTREMESASLTTPRTVVSDDGRASHPRLSSLLCELDVNKPPSRGYTIGTPGKGTVTYRQVSSCKDLMEDRRLCREPNPQRHHVSITQRSWTSRDFIPREHVPQSPRFPEWQKPEAPSTRHQMAKSLPRTEHASSKSHRDLQASSRRDDAGVNLTPSDRFTRTSENRRQVFVVNSPRLDGYSPRPQLRSGVIISGSEIARDAARNRTENVLRIV